MSKTTIILMLIVLCAFAIRFIGISEVPSSLYIDEVAISVDASLIASTGKDMHGLPWQQLIYPSYGDYKQAGYIWLAAIFVKIFGTDDWIIKLPSILAGVGTVVVGGLIAARLLTKSQVQAKLLLLVTASVITVAPWSVVFSRAAFEGHLAQFFFASAVLCFLQARKHMIWLVVAVLLGVFSTYTYYSVRFVFPVVLVLFSLYAVWQSLSIEKRTVKELAILLAKNLILPLGLYLLLILPLSRTNFSSEANQFRLSTDSVLQNEEQILQSNVYRELAGNHAVDRVFFHRTWLTAKELLSNVSDHLSLEYLFLSGDSNLRHGTGFHGLFILGMLPFFLLGIYGLARQKPLEGILLAGWWLASLLPASVPETTPHALRSLNALVPLAVIIGYGVVYFYHDKKGLAVIKQHNFVYKLLGSLLALGLLITSLAFLQYYFVVYPSLSQNSWYFAQEQTAHAITEMRKDSQPVYIVGIGDKFYLWMIEYGGYKGSSLKEVTEKGFIISSFDSVYDAVTLDSVPVDQELVLAVSAGQEAAVEAKFADSITEKKRISTSLGEHQTTVFSIR